MGWDKESLLTKAKIFFTKANDEEQDNFFFGLYCTMGLELLTRAVVSKVSPVLLAEPTRDQGNILCALGYNSSKDNKKSITTQQVIALCKIIIPDITDDLNKTALAMVNRRNEEMHTGSVAFGEYTTEQWIVSFYKYCKLLATFLETDLNDLFGKEQSEIAEQMILDTDSKIQKTVLAKITAFKTTFNDNSEVEKLKLKGKATENVARAVYKSHKVICPACGCDASISGREYGNENIEHKDNEIITRRHVMPESFKCSACGLKLSGYGELSFAGVGSHYTNRVSHSPEDYYDLVDPNDSDAMNYYVEEYLAENAYCNE